MSPPPRDLSRTNYEFEPDHLADFANAAQAGGGELEGGITQLARLPVRVDDLNLDYVLTLTLATDRGHLVIEEARLTRREGHPAITSTGLRTVALDAYLRGIRRELARRPEELGFGVEHGRINDTVVWRLPTTEEWAGVEAHQQRPRRPPVETLPAVVAAYREAVDSSDPEISRAPTAEVGRRLHYSRAHAARLVSKARKAGFLGPALKGRAGEGTARPPKATSTGEGHHAETTTEPDEGAKGETP
jgi:hypothetical protein